MTYDDREMRGRWAVRILFLVREDGHVGRDPPLHEPS